MKYDSKFVSKGLSKFSDGQIIPYSSYTSLIGDGGAAVDPLELIQDIENILSSNEGSTPQDAKDRNAIIWLGKYLNQQPIIIQPLGTGEDDWPRLFQYIGQAASTGQLLILASGNWYCLSNQDLQTTLLGRPFSMYCMPGVIFNVTLTAHAPGDESASPFYHNGGNALGTTTTINTTPTEGSNTLVVTSAANISVGDKIAIVRNASSRLQTNIVVAKVGTTLTLDGPIYFPYQNGDVVRVIPAAYQCKDIIIDFNHAQFKITSADKVIEFFSAWDCIISNINVVDGSGVVYLGCSFDMGSVRSSFINGTYKGKGSLGAGTSGAGFSIEGSRDCAVLNCNTEQCVYGVIVNNSYNWTVKGSGRKCSYGLGIVTANAADTYGSNYGYAEFSASNSVIAGVVVSDGSKGNFLKIQSTGNPIGIFLSGGASSSPSLNNQIEASFYGDVRGLVLDQASSGYGSLIFKNLSLHYIEVTGGSSFRVTGGFSSDSNNVLPVNGAAFLCQDANSKLYMLNYEVNIPNTSGASQISAFSIINDGYLYLSDVQIKSPGGSNRIGIGLGSGANSGFAKLKNVEMNGGSNGIVIYDATSYCWIDSQSDFSACATPYLLSGSTLSKGTVVANGAAAVPVVFPGIKSTSYVLLTRLVNGGAPGIMPYVTVTPGTGFSITSVAGDTSTYIFEII